MSRLIRVTGRGPVVRFFHHPKPNPSRHNWSSYKTTQESAAPRSPTNPDRPRPSWPSRCLDSSALLVAVRWFASSTTRNQIRVAIIGPVTKQLKNLLRQGRPPIRIALGQVGRRDVSTHPRYWSRSGGSLLPPPETKSESP